MFITKVLGSGIYYLLLFFGLPGGSAAMYLPAMWETPVRSLGWEDPLEKG